MNRIVSRLADALAALCRLVTGLAFAVLAAAVIVQVLGRSGLAPSPVWTEELTRFALLYLAAAGAGLAFRSGDLVNVDLVSESLPGRLPWLLRLLSALVTLGFALLLIGPAWRFVAIGRWQTSPALGWRMDFVHASVLVLLVTLAVFAAVRVLEMLSGASDGLPVKRDGDDA